ncbi:MAG: type IV pilus assembly protein PilM [Opitutaceae bacterium]|nr:type IV pilus assembly protein PilM [Verrucomicrobiales bacterium]
MLNAKSFLAADFGAGCIKLAEFEQNEAGGLRLKQFGVAALGAEGSQEATREGAILKALQGLLAERSYASKQISVCAPGYHVFSKFVKLPQVDSSKVTQIIQYEAQQNVPFPLDEVVWDYQILGTSSTGELEVLLVAIKTDVVERLFRAGDGAGLRLQLVDVSPAALCNAFRYNYGDIEGCTMLLDIGAKTSNLLFFEKGKVYARSINIGANSITQDFANEAKLPFAEAERIKIEKGFVSLGGAYEEPEDPQAAAISKIARQVMTRLHIQVNQTIQFYRGQQGGSAPQRLYLSGGGSIMTYAGQFFAEKLSVPVDYFNPFRNIQIDETLNLEELSKVAHLFGEVVGLGLRNLAHCPVELNLMPKSSIQRQEFSQKKPYLIASGISLMLVVFAIGWFYSKVVAIKENAAMELEAQVIPLRQQQQEMAASKAILDLLKKDADQLVALVDDRYFWSEVLLELQKVLRRAEDKTREKVGMDVGVWVETFNPLVPVNAGYTVDVSEGEAATSGPKSEADELFDKRYGPNASRQGRLATPTVAGSQLDTINLVCRTVNLEGISPEANAELAYELKSQFEANPKFGEGVVLVGMKKERGDALTYALNYQIKLKRPLRF